MTAVREVARTGRTSPLRPRARALSGRDVTLEHKVIAGLVLLVLVATALVAAFPDTTPLSGLMVPLLLGSLLLGPRHLPWFVVFVLVMLIVALDQLDEIQGRTVGTVAVQFLMGFIVLLASFRRSQLGVAGLMGESMLVDLRDRIQGQGGVPSVPEPWRVETALRSAGGTPFAGDFLVSARPAPDRLEIVVVDVSGKGEQAGTRALLLSGAFGGLLGALPPEQFLSAANDYLLRQDWEEGFATAVHFSMHLDSGAFEIRSAGHPPAAHRAAGSGRWSVVSAPGPVLGLIPEAEFAVARGVVRQGDAVLLYTDGMVEEPRRDIELGIDRMLGEAEGLLRGSFVGAAERLVEALGSRDDDRAMLVISRH